MKTMTPVERFRATMAMAPTDRLIRCEFGFMEGVKDNWKKQGLNGNWHETLKYDADLGQTGIQGLGWCEPSCYPVFETKVVEEMGDYVIRQDNAGRLVKFFKGPTSGYMPTYLKHAVSAPADWEGEVKPRLNPQTPERIADYDKMLDQRLPAVLEEGRWLTQMVIGQYMYLRALMGPEDIMYAFFDHPDMVEDMLDQWLFLADRMIERAQKRAELDEIFFGEDICYNHGLLISPDMWRQFLKPRYLDLIGRCQARQKKKILIHIDTDGRVDEAIPLYQEIGMGMMSPFEIAAGNDPVALAKKYPDLRIKGGINKMILSTTRKAIDEHLAYTIPALKARGGYIPVCDHGVPLEVNLDNYLYYRERITAMDH